MNSHKSKASFLSIIFIMLLSINGIAQMDNLSNETTPTQIETDGEMNPQTFKIVNHPIIIKTTKNGTLLMPSIYVDIDATGSNDGSSWANAYNDLSDALENANLNDEIWVADGTYLPNVPSLSTDLTKRMFLIWQDHQIYGGFNGTETNREERDPSTNITILSGDINGDDIIDDFVTNRSDNISNIIVVNSTITDATTLDGFTVMGGHASGDPAIFADRRGAGLFTLGPIELNNCRFTQNYAELWGGGAYYRDATSAGGRILNCTFEKNLSGIGGGGVSISSGNDMTVDNTSFIDNDGGERGGGYYSNMGSFTMTNCTFTGNTSTNWGGGSMILTEKTNDVITVTNCLFDNNTTRSGGGLFFQTVGINTQCTISSSTFSNNATASSSSVTPRGGGLTLQYSEYAGEPEITTNAMTIVENCQFINNTTTGYGAGIILNDHANGTGNSYVVRNCHIERNSAGEEAGGLYLEKFFNTNLSATISHTTFKNNDSPVTLEMSFFLSITGTTNIKPSGITKVHNCLFDHDQESNGVTTILSGDYLIEFSNCTLNSNAPGILSYTDTDIKLLNNIFNTAEFDNIAPYGGAGLYTSLGGNIFSNTESDWAIELDQLGTNPVFDEGSFQLSQNSPAVDAGIMPEDVANFDLAGNDRIQGGCIDIGAYESAYDTGIACTSVGVKEDIVSSAAMEIFPNPTSDVANISLENDWKGTLSLSILNILGQTVQSISIEKNRELATWNLNTNHLPKGTYKVLISNSTQMAVKTLVVIR